MPKTGWTPSIVPYGADQTVYLVVDRFGALGVAYRETDVVRTDLETTITDLMSGQFSDPVRVVAFNTAERWAQDVSKDIALEIQSRCDIEGHDVPARASFSRREIKACPHARATPRRFASDVVRRPAGVLGRRLGLGLRRSGGRVGRRAGRSRPERGPCNWRAAGGIAGGGVIGMGLKSRVSDWYFRRKN